MGTRLSKKDIIDRLEQLGHIYMSDFYVGSSPYRQVTYICRCGSENTTRVSTVSQGFGCPSCKSSNISKTLQKYTVIDIDARLTSFGQTLLEFTGMGKPLVYICHCGSIAHVKYTTQWLDRYGYCQNCRLPQNYTGGLKLDRRQITEYKKWRLDCLTRDNFVCQKKTCKSDLDLHVHHIEAFSLCEELRYSSSNGITLCNRCHIFSHTLFGKQFSKSKLEEFLETNYGY